MFVPLSTDAQVRVAVGGTVIAGLLCLLLSDLASNKAWGPAAAVGILFAVLGALTFLPAMLLPAGGAAFWPRRVGYGSPHTEQSPRDIWTRMAGTIRTHARPAWIDVAIVLGLACIGLVSLNASGIPAGNLLMDESPARDGQNVLVAHFPGGSGQPTQVIVPQEKLSEAATVALDSTGVSGASVVSADSPSGSIPIPTPKEGPFAQAAPTVVDHAVMLQLTLVAKGDSREAEQTVFRRGLGHLEPDIQPSVRLPRLRALGSAVCMRVLGRPRHRLQHIPNDPRGRGIVGARNEGGPEPVNPNETVGVR